MLMLALAALAPGALLATSPAARQPPNIVLILADDLAYSDLGCYGSEIQTPNIDRLARNGLRFTQLYTGAVCCPTRAALLTGLYPHQAGMGWMVNHGEDNRPTGPYQGYLNDQCVTLAEVLRSAGYRTLMTGKWHVGESRPHWPRDRGFERYFGLISGASNYFDISKDRHPALVRQMAEDDRPFTPPANFYMTDAIADRAVGYLDEYGKSGTPFFLFVSFTAPHSPLHARPEDIAKYRGRYKQGWDALRKERHARMQQLGIIDGHVPLPPRDPDVPPWNTVEDPDLMDLKMAIYAAQIDAMDQGIGRVLAKVRSIGAEENTMVLFLSDNGASDTEVRSERGMYNRPPHLGGVESYASYGKAWAFASSTPLRKYKRYVHEGGIAVPMIVSWPGVIRSPGGITHETAHVIDLMPTFVEATGAKYPAEFKGRSILPMEGHSLVPLLQGQSLPREAPLFWEIAGNRGVRHGDWKLVAEHNQPWELYNLASDRIEQQDLAAENQARVNKLVSFYDAWAERCGVRPWDEMSPQLRNMPVGVPTHAP